MTDLHSPVVPGHPLYAQFRGAKIIADALRPAMGANSEAAADVIIVKLLANDAPIYLVTEEEMKVSDG